ncbi:hypothetical protein BC834DRAFT_917604 [Gloeopeniophorella convolvens]|nr:hypothetical protein BC834DRAFT_917604 [Gloeopeniophorella convolvens]
MMRRDETRWAVQHPGRVVTLVHQEDWAASSAADAFSYEDVFWGACACRLRGWWWWWWWLAAVVRGRRSVHDRPCARVGGV